MMLANTGLATDTGVIRIGTLGQQVKNVQAGIFGSITGSTALPVLIDRHGQLGTVSGNKL